MIVSVTVCASHVTRANIDTGSELSLSIDTDGSEDTSLGSNDCGMLCGGCCVHHAVDTSHNANFASVGDRKPLMPDTTLFVSDVIYGLKRPPRS
ncbi:MAG: hypothetical protein ACRBBW_21140 [Cellvibrionaceae bacterium]